MELNYLVYFRTVAQTEHISQAAAQLHLTQPALSRAISRVEETVGTQLFERGANSIRLNYAGRAFLRRVEQILAEYDDAIREINDNADAETGAVKLMAPTLELVSGFLPPYLRAHPNMRVFHQLAGTETMIRELENSHADFAICTEPVGAVRLTWEPLFREEYRLAVPADHPLAGQDAVDLRDLAGERFIFNHGTSDFADLIHGFCCRAGFTPNVAFMGDETPFALDLVAEGRGVLFLAASMTDERQNRMLHILGDRIRFLDIQDQDCSRTIGLARLQNGYLSKTAEATLEAVRAYFQSLADVPGVTLL
jgi:DNA-binding transcriptional LysR family regulator